MHRLTTGFTVMAAVAFMLLAQVAYGQALAQLRVEIPFAFIAAGKELPSGTYMIKGESAGRISISNTRGKTATIVKTITSLARSSDADDHLLAFDKVGDTKTLSEVWLHGREGALVHATPGEHQHEVIRLVAKARIR